MNRYGPTDRFCAHHRITAGVTKGLFPLLCVATDLKTCRTRVTRWYQAKETGEATSDAVAPPLDPWYRYKPLGLFIEPYRWMAPQGSAF